MPENDTNVLCHTTSYLDAELSHSANLPLLKYIKQVQLLHQNLIKVRTPADVKASKIPIRCRLVIVPKTECQKKNVLGFEVPFETILISKPMVAVDNQPKLILNQGESEKSAPETPGVNENRAQNTEETAAVKPEEVQGKAAKKHIHPCICDLTKAQLKRIDSHLQGRDVEQSKYLARLRQIEQQARLLEEQAEQRELDCEIEHELLGDLSTCPKPKRKRNFARRLSMVSLGVKQVINWKKPPKIRVRYNRVFELRKDNTKYCNELSAATSEEPKEIVISEVVDFPVTKASQLRKQYNEKWIEEYNKQQEAKGKYPNRPEFVINYSKLWPRD